MKLPGIDLDVSNAGAVEWAEGSEESARLVHGAETEGVLGEEGPAISLVVKSAAGLQQIHSHSARDIALGGSVGGDGLDDGAIGGEAQGEDEMFDFLW